MKIDLGAALAIALLAALPAAALAQQQQHHEAHPAAPHPQAHAPAMRAPAPAMREHTERFHAAPAAHAFHPVATHRTVHRTVRRTAVRTTHAVRRTAGAHRVHHPVARARHNPRVAHLRKNVFARHRFHAGVYRAPPGYRYRRWRYGQFMPAAYWGRDFWITDFLAFGLFAPPPGYVWVRYGPDAVLIDEYTGEIVRVDYGVFF
ncbi:MAG TPA: RcnB family protein [Rhizomicrobium sp.]|jgi:Ni/Co efflux regulator RcnB